MNWCQTKVSYKLWNILEFWGKHDINATTKKTKLNQLFVREASKNAMLINHIKMLEGWMITLYIFYKPNISTKCTAKHPRDSKGTFMGWYDKINKYIRCRELRRSQTFPEFYQMPQELKSVEIKAEVWSHSGKCQEFHVFCWSPRSIFRCVWVEFFGAHSTRLPKQFT